MKKSEYLEIHVTPDEAPNGYPSLTLTLRYEKFVPDFSTELKEKLPKGSRIWWGDGDGLWHIHPNVKDQLIEISYRWFDEVYWVEDGRSAEIRTGLVQPTQGGLFG
jgi:hypothetical protein